MGPLPYFCEKVSQTANPKWLQARIQVNFAFEKVSWSIDECATLYQMANMQPIEISKTLGKCKAFVFKWYKRDLSDPTNFYDSPRKGAPVTALTPENMTKLADCEGKLGQSVSVLRDKLGISTGSVSISARRAVTFEKETHQSPIQSLKGNATQGCRILGTFFDIGREDLDSGWVF